MAHEAQGKSGAATQAEQLTEQERRELDQESIQSEIDAEMDRESEAEEEVGQHEIEIEVLEALDIDEIGGRGGARRGRRAVVTRLVMRQMVRTILVYTRAVVKRMHRSASLRRKLLAASRRGPRAVRALVGLAVLRAMPRPFRQASRRLIPMVVVLSFRAIARQAGLNAQEIDAAELESAT
jgi:hypothetical protein